MIILSVVNEEHTFERTFYRGANPKKAYVRKAVAYAFTHNLIVQVYFFPSEHILEWSRITEVQGRTKQINHTIHWMLRDEFWSGIKVN